MVQVKKGSFAKVASPTTTQSVDVGFKMEDNKSFLILWCTKQTAEGLGNQGFFGIGYSDGIASACVTNASNDAAAAAVTTRWASALRVLAILVDGVDQNPAVKAFECTVAFTSTGFDLTYQTNDANQYLIHYLAVSGLKRTEVGNMSLATTGSPQTKTLTDPNLLPNFLMILGINNANSASPGSSAQNSNLIIGAASSTSNQWAMIMDAEDTRTTMDTWKWHRQDSVYLSIAGSTGAVDARCSLNAFNVGSFALNMDDLPGGTDFLYYLVVEGGAFYCEDFIKSTTTPNVVQSITGVGFKPAAVMLFHCKATTLNPTAATAPANIHLGAADQALNEGSVSVTDEDAVADADCYNRFNTTKVIQHTNEADGSILSEADLQSMDRDGFTLNWTTNNSSAIYIGMIAIGDMAEFHMAGINRAMQQQGDNAKAIKRRTELALAKTMQLYRSLNKPVIGPLTTNVLVTDSGAGSETILVNKGLMIPESGSGDDSIFIGKNLKIDESGVGADSIFVGKNFIIIDSGSGSDAVSVIKNFFIPESGSGADTILVNKNVLIVETGSGVEALLLAKQLIVSETATGTDTLLIDKDLIVTDAGSGLEVALVGKNIIIIDSGAGSETVNVLKNLLLQEAASGLDSVQINKNILLSEIASGLESVLANKNLFIAESGAGIDVVNIGKTLFIADSALGVDNAFIGKTISLQELASGADLVSVGKAFIITDTGLGSENIIVVTGDMSTNRLTPVKVLLLRAKNRINLMRSVQKPNLQRTIAKTQLLRNSVKSFLKRSKSKVILEDE